jgi:hypothetical protein
MCCALAISRSWLDLSPPSSATNHGEAVFPAVNTIAWAAVNAKFDDIGANRLAVAPLPQRQPRQSGQNLLLPNLVSQCSQPRIKFGSAFNEKHGWSAIHGLQHHQQAGGKRKPAQHPTRRQIVHVARRRVRSAIAHANFSASRRGSPPLIRPAWLRAGRAAQVRQVKLSALCLSAWTAVSSLSRPDDVSISLPLRMNAGVVCRSLSLAARRCSCTLCV